MSEHLLDIDALTDNQIWDLCREHYGAEPAKAFRTAAREICAAAPEISEDAVEQPEWIECASLAQSLTESRKRHKEGYGCQLTRHQAELFWHCDQVLKENATLRAALRAAQGGER